jgi:hypothetical protein
MFGNLMFIVFNPKPHDPNTTIAEYPAYLPLGFPAQNDCAVPRITSDMPLCLLLSYIAFRKLHLSDETKIDLYQQSLSRILQQLFGVPTFRSKGVAARGSSEHPRRDIGRG